MCDTYGAPGCDKEIDIEELERKGQRFMSQEFPKPTLEEITKFKPFVNEILTYDGVMSSLELNRAKRRHKFNYKNSFLFHVYMDLVALGDVSNEKEDQLRKCLQIKAVKSNSGITSITVFTAAYPEYTNELGEKVKQDFSCEHNCSFCPSAPNMPKSYLLLEPAVLRAVKHEFDCVEQIHDRLNSLYMIGHDCLKLEINILGGTFSAYPREYRDEFIRDVYYAANTFFGSVRERLSLSEEKKQNETARTRIVLIAVELRPDSITINPKTGLITPQELRYLSITRIQMGIQHIDDEILRKNNRKCPTVKTVKTIELLKRLGYKIDGHFMPNLPGSTHEKDRDMLINNLIGLKRPIKREVKGHQTMWQRLMGIKTELEYWEYYDLNNSGIQVDQIKIYPTAVTIHTEIEKWYKEGTYIPYDEKYLIDMLLDFKSMIFPWIRINRIMRDFYVDNIWSKSGSNMNMRCELVDILKKEGKRCDCIRCREIKGKEWDGSHILVIRKYNASNGDEYFISAESADNQDLYGFVRLRLDDRNINMGLFEPEYKVFPELNGAALLREAHVYSTVTQIGDKGNVQHKGLGSKLMKKAEDIARNNGYRKIAVIASIGSRTFYEKIGYSLNPGEGEYMIKEI